MPGKMQLTNDLRFLERLDRGPAGLLLGQSHLALGAAVDPLVQLLARKLEVPDESEPSYRLLFEGSDIHHDPALLHWLDEKSRSLAASEHLETIARYPWIGVWSSAIDSVWANSFENSWREVQKVFSESFRPPDPRNRRRLHCTYLFGSLSRSDPDERPPITRLEFLQRKAVAQALTRRVLDALGPTGTLAIDALGSLDWFQPEDLVGLVAQMQPGQCHLFNTSVAPVNLPELRELEELGLITPHTRALAAVLAEGAQAGQVELGRPAEEGDLQRVVSFAGRVQTVPKDIWIGLSTAAHLIDESTLAEPKPLTDDSRYMAFRSFLGSSDTRARWEGVQRGFAFHREFQDVVVKSVRAAISQRELPDRPVVVHGATGTGKTTALAYLAIELARERALPVLYLDRMAPVRAQDTINRFGKWAEDEGAPGTLVIWDGMFNLDVYDGVARFFASRGRRVVLVGSSYRVGDTTAGRRRDLVLAPSELSTVEFGRLSSFLGGFDQNLSDLTRLGAGQDASFLVYLYRLLPPTRASVRTGVVRELEHTERLIAERAVASASTFEHRTTLGWALMEAGLLPSLDLEEPAVAGEADEFSAIEDLTALVMVAAQFGLTVPLEIALRATGRLGYSNLPSLLRDIDLVRWIEDRAGNFHLGARSRLEAQLIVASRLGTPSTEVSYARRLIVEVREEQYAVSGASEVDFAIDLVRALGAQGPSPQRYALDYPSLAEALAELRTERGVTNSRLMLQEANLLREWSIKQQQRGATLDDDDRRDAAAALVEAAAVLTAALDHVPGVGPRDIALRNRLHVELATTYASQAKSADLVEQSDERRKELFEAARATALQARAEDQESYYPVDVLAWATRDALQDGVLSATEVAEASAEVLNSFELLDPADLDASQVERYHERRQQFADLIGNADIADDAFDALLADGSGAGVYLRARGIADPTRLPEVMDAPTVAAIESAMRYLDEFPGITSSDPRCMNLRFDLWWRLNANQRPFSDERFCPPFGVAQWHETQRMASSLNATERSYREVPLLFLRGLAEFHLGDLASAFDTFDDVERRSEEVRGRRRIIRTYLASTAEGSPNVYTGTVSSLSRDLRRGQVYVDELRRRVTFLPGEFASRELTRGASLGEFHIGFNFLGVVADPTAYYRQTRS